LHGFGDIDTLEGEVGEGIVLDALEVTPPLEGDRAESLAAVETVFLEEFDTERDENVPDGGGLEGIGFEGFDGKALTADKKN
jgi:hypothetical protein